MTLQPGDRVDHLYFGVGKIILQTTLCNRIKFGDGEVRDILKGHATLKKGTKYAWTIDQKIKAQQYIEQQVSKRLHSHGSDWRAYPKS